MKVKLNQTWKSQLAEEFEKPYFQELTEFVRSEYLSNTVYPPPRLIFAALDAIDFEDVKVVILGQDPYHGPGQANGLSFSVNKDVSLPPSLKNIYKELESDLGAKPPNTGDLNKWARQGVLLLNATLTVRAKSPGSHQNKGWEEFTDQIIRKISENRKNIVFILWGKYAQNKGEVINRDNNHLIIKSPHPSPYSADRGFFGSKPFSQTNDFLKSNDINEIDW